jgi:putative acetyltransferase
LHLRAYREEDAPALLALYRDTIRRVNARDYSPEQVRAWAPEDIDPGGWARRFAGRFWQLLWHWRGLIGHGFGS